ncbi:MAG TPA: hypothetical protein VG326_07840 [Tepidisphaeraceae bacterium]|nr:hypothetical protein [Tepidisphaeraceae bacterium]
MSDQLTLTTFFGRLGNMFRRPTHDLATEQSVAEQPAASEVSSSHDLSAITGGPDNHDSGETRTTFLRPWTRRDQGIEHLQVGMSALTDLMATIRGNLERDAQRQDEILAYLSRLPQAIDSLPETSRVQGETLKAIQQGIDQQNAQQSKLAEVLERIVQADDEHREALLGVRDRADTIAQREQEIGRSLSTASVALETVSKNSESSARVLENLRDNLSSRDSDWESVIRRQNTRLTTMLTAAIVMSMAALTAVVVFGYLGYQTLSHIVK